MLKSYEFSMLCALGVAMALLFTCDSQVAQGQTQDDDNTPAALEAGAIAEMMAELVPPATQKHSGESEADAKKRYGMIATSIEKAAGGDRTLALFLIVTARHESTFSIRVHSGEKRGDGGASWGLFQINCGKSKTAKCPLIPYRANEIVGLEAPATERSADAGARHLKAHMPGCRNDPYCVWKAYVGAPRGPMSPRIKALVHPRVTTYFRLLNQIR